MTPTESRAGGDPLGNAETETALAKARLFDTIGRIKARLKPANIRDDAIDTIKAKTSEYARNAEGFARERPVAIAVGIAGVALFAARRPLLRLVRRLFSRR